MQSMQIYGNFAGFALNSAVCLGCCRIMTPGHDVGFVSDTGISKGEGTTWP